MTVLQSTVTRAKPGRRHEAIAIGLEAEKLLERHGATNNRFLTAQAAGEATGSDVFTSEFENLEAWGDFTDRLSADAELEALLTRINGENSPIVMESMSIGSEIPLGRSGPMEPGKVVEVYISRPNPGAFDAALGLAVQVFDFVENNGATACRLLQLNNAGSLTGCLVASWELPTMKAAGRLGDAYEGDPAGQQILEVLTGANAPIVTVSSGIYVEIEI